MAQQDQQDDWKYVFTIRGDLSNPDGATLAGPFEDVDAADEYVEDRMAMQTTGDETNVVASLLDPDAVLAALKKSTKLSPKKLRKAEKKAAKEAAKKAAAEKGNGNGKGKKNKKNKKAAAATDTASPDEGEVSPEQKVANAAGEVLAAEADAEANEAQKARYVYNGSLKDDKDKLIESWSRAMTKHDVIGPLNLTPQQRRVVAALKWVREVNKSNAHMPGTVIPPAPIVGIDAKGRLVVQALDDPQMFTGKPKQWAVLKNGDPTDVTLPVERLKRTVAETV